MQAPTAWTLKYAPYSLVASSVRVNTQRRFTAQVTVTAAANDSARAV
jgi:hypothetical protein